jgi:hypothetical protein
LYLERGPLGLVRVTEELFERKRSGSGSRKPRLTAVVIRCAHHATLLYTQKLVLTSLTWGGRSSILFACRLKPRSLVSCDKNCSQCFLTKFTDFF